MMPPGHVVVGWAAGRLAQPDRREAAWFAILGAVLPDVIDKLVVNLHWFSWSRWYGHSLWVWLALAALWAMWRQRQLGWVVLGGCSHLVADLVGDLLVGTFRTGTLFTGWLFWPLVWPSQLRWSWMEAPLPSWWAPYWVEGAFVVAVAVVWAINDLAPPPAAPGPGPTGRPSPPTSSGGAPP